MGNSKKIKERINGIAFDLEGTIIDLERFHHQAHLQAALDIGLELSLEEAIRNIPHFVGGPDEAVASEIASLFARPVSVTDLTKAKKKYFDEFLNHEAVITARDGFKQFLLWAKQIGIQIAIGTVSKREQAIDYLMSASLLSEINYQCVVAREDVSLPKPSPEVYRRTAEKMGISTVNQLVIEDSVVGIKSATGAGSRVIAVPTVHIPDYLDLLLSVGAEMVFLSWTDPALRGLIQSIQPTPK